MSLEQIEPAGIRLLGVLQALIGQYRQLNEICRRERDALVQAELDKIQLCAHEKSLVIEQIRQTEWERRTLLSQEQFPATLQEWVLLLQPVNREVSLQLQSALSTLLVLVDSASKINRENQDFINRSLIHIEQMKKNVLGEASPQQQSYNKKGAPQTMGSTAPKHISGEL